MNFGGIQVQNAVQNREIKQSKQVFKLLCDSFKQPNTETNKKNRKTRQNPLLKNAFAAMQKPVTVKQNQTTHT